MQPLTSDDPAQIGTYRLRGLSAGGMGRVYLAHTPAGRPVALKVVRSDISHDQIRVRFDYPQGAVIASEGLGDYGWVKPIWESMRKVIAYRERTQFDEKYGLFFWENAISSGADDNTRALTNDPNDKSAILATDISTFQLREYKAMAQLADNLGKSDEAAEYRKKAAELRAAMLKHMWFPQDAMFHNIRRDTGKPA